MSSSVNGVIFSVLGGNAPLVALLAVDPRGGPAIYYDHKSETAPLYPQITFRESTNTPVPQLIDKADLEIYDFEIWTQNERASGVTAIFEAMDPLLHRQYLEPSDVNAHNWMWQTLRISGGGGPYDKVLKAYVGLYRYAFRHMRF